MAGQGVALLSVKPVREELDLQLLRVAAEPRLYGGFYWLCGAQNRTETPAAAQVKDWLPAQAV